MRNFLPYKNETQDPEINSTNRLPPSGEDDGREKFVDDEQEERGQPELGTTLEILNGLESSRHKESLSAMGRLAVLKNFDVNLERGLTPKEIALGYKQILHKMINRVIIREQQIRSRMSIGAMIQMWKITQAILNPNDEYQDNPIMVLKELKEALPDEFK